MESTERDRYRDSLSGFIESYKWHYYLTLTFRNPVGFETAYRRVEGFLSRFGVDLYAYSAFEKGVAGERTHCHLLLGWRRGGMCEINRVAFRRILERRWTHGRTDLNRYEPHRGAARYLTKDAYEYPEQGSFLGRPKKLTRRKRGRKKKVIQ